jgi:hypothetical protein
MTPTLPHDLVALAGGLLELRPGLLEERCQRRGDALSAASLTTRTACEGSSSQATEAIASSACGRHRPEPSIT